MRIRAALPWMVAAWTGCDFGRIALPGDSCPDVPCRRAGEAFRHGDAVEHVVFSPSGRYLASADRWGAIKLWRTETGEPWAAVAAQGHCRYALALAFAPDEGTLLTCTPGGPDTGGVRLSEWYLDGALRREVRLDALSPGCRACFSADGSTAAFQSTNWTAYVVDVATGRIRLAVPGKSRSCAIALSTNGRLLATASEGLVSIWDVETHALFRRIDPRLDRYESPPMIDSLAFSPDAGTVAVGLCGRGVALYPPGGNSPVHGRPLGACPTSIAFSPDGRTVAAGNGGGISILDAGTGEARASAGGLPGRACMRQGAVGFSPDGRTLASGVLGTSSIHFWDARSGRILAHPACTAR